MFMDQRARVLETVLPGERGIREVIKELGWAPSRIVDLFRKMEDEGLIIWMENSDMRSSMRARRGRPKKIMMCTSLGIEFLETYEKLEMKPLRARKEDLEQATRDAQYTERLVTAGHSPFQLFMELNDIVSNIKISSEATQSL
jgi:DNA-binding PadR family transcriptional regulator